MWWLAFVVALDSVQVGPVTLIAPPGREALGTLLAEQAAHPVDWPGLGRRTPPPFTLILAPDSAALARMTRGRAPGWGAGVAFPSARTIILRADLPDLSQTLRHELGHLILGTTSRSAVPLWFDEGYAAWGSGELGRAETLELNLAVASGKVPGFEELNGMLRGSATTADVAYALAASAVSQIDRGAPEGGMQRLMARLATGEPFDSALTDATGLTPDRFEERWQNALKRQYSFFTWLVAGGMWALIAFSLGGLLWYRRAKDAPRRAALDVGWPLPVPEGETETPPEPPAPPPAGGPVDPGAPRQ